MGAADNQAMPVHIMSASEALALLATFDTVIDARSPSEHDLDHVPGAINWPTLNDAERITIGTLYKQVNPLEARKKGAVLAARNIANHIERHALDKPKGWRPLVYCWRGGQRSGSLATVLGAIGFHVTLIEGGYRAWRAALLADLPTAALRLSFRVVCGPTGSGKTRLLQALRQQGAQVIDLEALARHRSSVLGHVPGVPQPSQKRFDSLVWAALRQADPARVVYVESESKKVGNLRLPDTLMDVMRSSPCLDLELADDERVALLMEDYPHFLHDADMFCRRLEALTERVGKATVQDWIKAVRAGETAAVVRTLLASHYDPLYAGSTSRNFTLWAQSSKHRLQDRHPTSFAAVARAIRDEEPVFKG